MSSNDILRRSGEKVNSVPVIKCIRSVPIALNSSLTILFISVFVDLLGYGIMLPLLPFYVQAQQGSAAIAGVLLSVYSSAQLVSGPILGGNESALGESQQSV